MRRIDATVRLTNAASNLSFHADRLSEVVVDPNGLAADAIALPELRSVLRDLRTTLGAFEAELAKIAGLPLSVVTGDEPLPCELCDGTGLKSTHRVSAGMTVSEVCDCAVPALKGTPS